MPGSPASSSPPDNFRMTQPPLRRLTHELFGIIVLKIAVLMLIWWVVFAPQPKPDVSPAAIAQRLAPTSQAPPEARP